MRCAYPVTQRKTVSGTEFRYERKCGQCLACRITRRQEWTFRILAEAKCWPWVYFLTLTLSDASLLERSGKQYVWDLTEEDFSVEKTDVQAFFKRFRYHLGHKIRYFAVGEYGDDKHRPHYHAVVFSPQEIGIEIRKKPGKSGENYWHSAAVAKSWFADSLHELPFVGTREGMARVAAYVAGYVVKKITNMKSIEAVYPGRKPEFSLASRNPGIGALFMPELAKSMLKLKLSPEDVLREESDTRPVYMARLDGKLWPLDRTMRRHLADAFGGEFKYPLEAARSADALLRARMADVRGAERARATEARLEAQERGSRGRRVF